MSERSDIRREVGKLIRTGNGDGNREQSGNPRPANWPAPPQDKVDRITKGTSTPPAKPKP